MAKKRRTFTPEFKTKVALEALKEQMTLGQLASKYDVHPVQISKWKKHLRENLVDVFRTTHQRERQQQEELQSELYEQIGRLKMELDWLKKKMESIK